MEKFLIMLYLSLELEIGLMESRVMGYKLELVQYVFLSVGIWIYNNDRFGINFCAEHVGHKDCICCHSLIMKEQDYDYD